ncbi:hypothetical protein MATL_G00048150 [Megalops atlanticus]|uniref:Ig-like domain-containing protein n=1 Tax=Megalops atlanticus TaxID=7932 RepID=A0A9D3TIR9_MEGAT|nr:hypothetical protein MATL_G00048150 [Megalops atlanticus]
MKAGWPVATLLFSNRNQNTTSLLLCLIFITGSLAIKVITPGNVTAVAGNPVMLTCALDGEGKVVQVEWSRCNGQKLFIYHTDHGENVFPDYKGRISMVTASDFTLQETRANDSGPYCCALSTYPYGTLQGRLTLFVRTDAVSLSSMVSVYIVCGVLGIAALGIAVLACVMFYQGRRVKVRNPVHVAVHSGGLPQNNQSFLTKIPSPKQPRKEEEEEKNVEKEEESGAEYFNVMTSSSVMSFPNTP